MLFNKLFKKDHTGAIRFWQMELEGFKYRSHHGVVGGTTVTDKWTEVTQCKSKDTLENQAEFEAYAKHQKKLDGGYHQDVNQSGAKFHEPMLARKYDQKLLPKNFIIQPKLDGIRCIADGADLKSRKGKPITSVPHIAEMCEEIKTLYPDVVLDGELYIHSTSDNFNEIVSAVRKQKPSEMSAKVEYWVYDIIDTDKNFLERQEVLREIFKLKFSNVKLVQSVCSSTKSHVEQSLQNAIHEGYEGVMIRSLETPYECGKRSKSLLKYKEFHDDEYEILHIEEGQGNWAGYAKVVHCVNLDGKLFSATLKGNQTYCKQVLSEVESYKGGTATVRYFELTPDGVPRFPVAVDIHKGERDD